MPRCETCMRMRGTADVRKMPGRESHRCKDKFDCLLAETNREAWEVTFMITFPALDEREAAQIVEAIDMKPFPIVIESIQKAERPAA